eukprot:9469461-Pyramimonas_sp.AAC.1
MCRASEPYWEVWRLIFWKLNDVGSENVNLQWMPSHKSRTWLKNHDFSDSWYPGNWQADKYARLGALEHPVVPQLDQRIQAAKNFGRQFARLLAGTLRRLSTLGFPDVDKVPRATKVPRQTQVRWGCRICGVNAARRSAITKNECPGKPRVLARTHESHRMWVLGSDLYFCMQCGGHARKQVKDLAARCHRFAGTGKVGALKFMRQGMDPTSK